MVLPWWCEAALRQRAGVSIAALIWLAATAARAEDFFSNSPGPLSAPHKKWDDSNRCTACHELGEGVTDTNCLQCHSHEPLRLAIERGEGLHARFDEPCITCHTEHKGRAASIISWRLVGGRQSFDHSRTGFPLAGRHAKVPCSNCHKRRLMSGRTSYVGLRPACDSCHGNPHNFSPKYRKRCALCHKPGTVQQMRGRNVPFDHAKVAFPLKGAHARARCVACHKNGDMRTREPPRSCPDCHRRHPHGDNERFQQCRNCHAPQRPWKQVTFDHDLTKLPLRGKHAKIGCKACHKRNSETLSPNCASCHEDPHRGRFSQLACNDCHQGGLGRATTLDHAAHTKFPLVGAHRRVPCRACHRGTKPHEFEKVPTECRACHEHANAHGGQFGDKPCLDCHRAGGSGKLVFNHNTDSRFPLVGWHARLARRGRCNACHKPAGAYRMGKVACRDCHEDTHGGQLGPECQRCHSPEVKFARTQFDHRMAAFALTGKHTEVECQKCHPNRLYKHGRTRCVDCHAKDDKHAGRLGKECERCHEPVPGASLFDHTTMTRMPLTGKHRETACGFCHRPPREPPPKVGWTRGLTPPPPDPLFRVSGHRCADCHFDYHKGRYGDGCGSCHEPTAFTDAKGPVHDTGSFRLGGLHNQIRCDHCHTENRPLAGTGDMCQTCHLEDDEHNNSLGPFCGDCHGQWEWTPTRFDHGSTGFLLRGAHRIAPCDGCHGTGTYQGTPTDCITCHGQEALLVEDPLHSAELSECELCHSEVAFVPARSYHPTYPLTGAHLSVRCSDCHASAYAGTPNECVECHWAEYVDPVTDPDHVSAGFSTDCELCHSTSAWVPTLKR